MQFQSHEVLAKIVTQYKYRTFTSDPVAFPQVDQMFANLRGRGVKCCTNITPIISLDGENPGDEYPTLLESWDRTDINNPAKK